ncbi:hypothetical protein Aperf_G00000000035 [Anoplocephala perfoliata]
MGDGRTYLALLLILQLGLATVDDDEAALTMEIEIESPGGSKGEELIPDFLNDQNCLSGRSCHNAGVCRSSSTLIDGSIVKGACICPLGYSGTFCEEKVNQTRFPELQDGGYLAFGGWLFPQTGTFSVKLQIKPRVLHRRTLLFFYNSLYRAQAYYLELNNEILHLRIYNKSVEGHFYLSRLLQHPTKLHTLDKGFFDIAFGLRAMNELYLSLDRHEVLGTLEAASHEDGIVPMTYSFSRENLIYIGGHSSLTHNKNFPIVSEAETSLIGCIGDIVINGHLCDPRQGSYTGDVVSGYGITTKNVFIVDCSRNVCARHVCEGDAACKPVSSMDYVCHCPLGTRPPRCKKGGAPRPTVDQINFLREFIPEINNVGRIGGFVGCVSDIKIMGSPVRLKDSAKAQNIDVCSDKEQ